MSPPSETGQSLRQRARSGKLRSVTVGKAAGYVQCNIIILPRSLEADFRSFCTRNPQACPLLSTSEAGDPFLPDLGADIDIRTDVPRYRVWRDGQLVAEPTDIMDYWREDLVTFALGCSFSFEEALVAAGVRLRHLEQGKPVPVYLTSIQTRPAGMFHGPLAVTMRPLTAADAIRAIQVTTRFPAVHGAPIHIGDPALIGIDNLAEIYEGMTVPLERDELPVFWACGVTPQAAVLASRLPFCITHCPGHMLVTDRRNAELAVM